MVYSFLFHSLQPAMYLALPPVNPDPDPDKMELFATRLVPMFMLR